MLTLLALLAVFAAIVAQMCALRSLRTTPGVSWQWSYVEHVRLLVETSKHQQPRKELTP